MNLRATRSRISNQYSRISLHIMAKFIRDLGVIFESKLEKDETISSELGAVQQHIQAYLDQHQAQGAYTSRPEHWLDKQVTGCANYAMAIFISRRAWRWAMGRAS